MNTISMITEGKATAISEGRSIPALLEPLEQIAAGSANLTSNCAASFTNAGRTYELPRYVFIGPRGGIDMLRVGIFAVIHGDEPEGAHGLIQFVQLLERSPDLARGYCLFLYPICNPTGYEDSTRRSRAGVDLNRHFWVESTQPEVRLLEAELSMHQFHGVISLHSDSTTDRMHGTARGASLTRDLLEPALDNVSEILPVRALPAPFTPGSIAAPPHQRPKPFEIALSSPRRAPQLLQYEAFALAVQSILAEYRKLLAYAQHL